MGGARHCDRGGITMIRDDDAKDLADIKAAYDLLEGICDTDEKGLPVAAYLEEGSSREIEARKALARLLRNGSPLDSLVRHLLAVLFDPTPYEYETKGGGPSIAQWRYPTRRLVFKGVPGRKRGYLKRLKLAEDVRENILRNNSEHKKISVEEAIAQVADKYGISDKTVWDAWETFPLSHINCK